MEWIHLLEKELVDIRGKLESVTEQLNVALEERSVTLFLITHLLRTHQYWMLC